MEGKTVKRRNPFKMLLWALLEGIYVQYEEAIVLNEGIIVKNELSANIFDIADVKFDIVDVNNGYIIYTVILVVISKGIKEEISI